MLRKWPENGGILNVLISFNINNLKNFKKRSLIYDHWYREELDL